MTGSINGRIDSLMLLSALGLAVTLGCDVRIDTEEEAATGEEPATDPAAEPLPPPDTSTGADSGEETGGGDTSTGENPGDDDDDDTDGNTSGDSDESEQGVSYHDTVAPLLNIYCLECHDDADESGGINMSTHAKLIQTGAVEPGNADASKIIMQLESNMMPPDGHPGPSDEAVDWIREWIDDGALDN